MLTFRYLAPNGTSWTVNLGAEAIRLAEVSGLVEVAEHGAVGSSSLTIDDPLATAGHSSDAILGLQRFEVDEGDEAVGNRRVFTGYTGPRTYTRGRDSFRTGVARTIAVELRDLNSLLGNRIITSAGSRPSETAAVRIAWLLASGFCPVVDNGYVFAADLTAVLDAADYTGQTAANVVSDCALAANVNHFVYYDEAQGEAALWLGDSNYRTDYSSTLRISNVAADWDGTTTFGPSSDASLTRSPDRLAAGIWMPYATGAVYRTNATTGTTYLWRDQSAPNANIKTSATATVVADTLLNDAAAEDDHLTVEYETDAAYVNDVRPGQRLQVKFSHLPGYTAFRWCRVLRRTVAADLDNEARYTVTLELSPQPELTASVAYLMRPNDSGTGGGSSGYIWWDYDGDNPKPGDAGPDQAGYVEYYPDGSKPANGWTGIEVTGSGVVDISVKFTGIEAFAGVGVVTISVQRNGTTIGSETINDPGGPGAHVWTWTTDFDVASVLVRRGDILTVYFSANITSTIPAGVGAGDHHFSATGNMAIRP